MTLRETGSVSMTSRVMTCVREACCTSTCGVSPETVMVSSSAPTFMSALIVITTSDGTSTAVAHDGAEARQRKREFVNAGSQRVDAVAPLVVGDGRSDFSMMAGLAASTVTPGSTPPDSSRT